MAYADYSFYCNDFHGDMAETDFEIWSGRASNKINLFTQGKAAFAHSIMSKALKMCCCALAENLLSENIIAKQTQNGAVVSENIDGYAVHYIVTDSKALEICAEYLTYPENLLYRGL